MPDLAEVLDIPANPPAPAPAPVAGPAPIIEPIVVVPKNTTSNYMPYIIAGAIVLAIGVALLIAYKKSKPEPVSAVLPEVK